MDGKKIFYLKIILAQVAGYVVSLFLIQKVFLGPAPVVRAEFVQEVQQLPSTIKNYVVLMPSKVKNFIAGRKQKSDTDVTNPPPWVFEPLPGEVLPSDRPRPTDASSAPPGQPTNQPANPPSDQSPTEAPRQNEPTQRLREPQPTRRPAQPTSVPANPSTLEQQVVSIINQRRRAAGLGELSIDGALTNAARGHSQYMSGGRGRCGHVGESGSSPFDRARTSGYRGQLIGETVACAYTTAQAAVDGWWSSPPHKAILMTSGARQIGMGWTNNYQTALVAR